MIRYRLDQNDFFRHDVVLAAMAAIKFIEGRGIVASLEMEVRCGGDCLECMAECGDPDAQTAMKKIIGDRSGEKYLDSDESERSV